MIKNKKLKTFTIIIAVVWLILSIYQLSMYFSVKRELLSFDILFALLLSIFAPIYFIMISRYFRKNNLSKKSVISSLKYIFIFIIIDYALSVLAITIVDKFVESNANSSLDLYDFTSAKDILIMYISLAWSLAGEEGGRLAFYFFTDDIISVKYFKNNENIKYYVLWAINSLLFGILHLSAYDFNILQCIFVIGVPSFLYAFIWKKTKNPKVLWITHLLYDYLAVSLVVLQSVI